MKKLTLLFILLILIFVPSCNQYPDINIAGNCERYGVDELNQPMGEIREIKELYSTEVQKKCKSSGFIHYKAGGCVIDNKDGTVDVFYENGNTCVKNHELCHVMHGPYHTKEYVHDVLNKHPNPTCPSVL